MTMRLRVFVSSVQKELEDERLIVQNLMNTDPFLSTHCLPVLYELEPASPEQAVEGCLRTLDGSSPGFPPAPITLASLRKGKYRPCSRNPVLAQCLSYFHRIEERGSGFRRMTDQMLDHGLDRPLIGTDTGYFQVTFPGPGENIERLRVPEGRLLVTPAVEAQLNERQRKILAHALKSGSVTTGWCMETLDVVRDTAHRDLVGLVELDLLVRKGSGRGARYLPKEGGPA